MVENSDKLSNLMADAQRGNTNSYRILLEQTSNTLSKYLARRIISHEDREDVLQEILLAIHNSRHTYLPSRPFFPWMYTIAKNVLSKHYKKIQQIKANTIEAEIQSLPIPDKKDATDEERIEELKQWMEELPGKQKRILFMLKLQGLSIREVAAKLHLSEANVKVIAHRGYTALRKLVKL